MLLLLIFILSLSFFNLMFVSGILSGLINTVTQTVINTSTADLTVNPQQEPIRKNFIENQDRVRQEIQQIPGILATVRHYLLAASISFDKEKNGNPKVAPSQVIGIDPEQDPTVFTTVNYLVAGQWLAPSDRDQIVLGQSLAGGGGSVPLPTDLGGAKVGDKVQVAYSNGVTRTYTVKGIFNITFGAESTNAYITAAEAESVLGVYNDASQILVKANLSSNSLNTYARSITMLYPTLQIFKYTDLLSVIGKVLDAFSFITFIISAVSVIVGAITIFVLIYINAISKRRQIGILRAIGIKRSVIVLSYVLQALFYSIAGIAVGSILVFEVLYPYVVAHPLQLPFGNLIPVFSEMQIVVSIAALLVAGLFAGFVPARMVSRENILKSIWG